MKSILPKHLRNEIVYAKLIIGIIAVVVAIVTQLWGIAVIGGILFLNILGSWAGTNSCNCENEKEEKSCEIRH